MHMFNIYIKTRVCIYVQFKFLFCRHYTINSKDINEIPGDNTGASFT